MCVCWGRSRGPCRQLQRLLVLQHEKKLFWAKDLAKVHFDEAVYHIYISLYIYIVLFSRCEVRTFWIELTEYDRIEPSLLLIKWCSTPKHDSGCGFCGWFAKDFSRKFCEFPRKQWRKRRCPWKPIAHTTPSCRQGNLETMKLCGFLVELYIGLAPTLGCLQLPFTFSLSRHLSSKKVDNDNPAKENRGFARDLRTFFVSRRMAVCRWTHLDQPPYI